MASRGIVSGIAFPRLCRAAGLPPPLPEFRFAAAQGRGWRFDYAWIDAQLALEVDGAIWSIGRHQRPDGWRKDQEKLNAAVVLGWRVLHVEPADLATAPTLDLVRRALAWRPPA
jgi:very-short-patch-repair endonuclease